MIFISVTSHIFNTFLQKVNLLNLKNQEEGGNVRTLKIMRKALTNIKELKIEFIEERIEGRKRNMSLS